jgi:polyisoprenoid-binding protein YceI
MKKMKKTILLTALVLTTGCLFAQKKTTTSATIAFDASTSIDNLPKAENKTAIGAIDPETGTVQFEATVKNFAFSNPSLQGHFNGNKWLNSDEFPKFSFNGKIVKLSEVKFKKNGSYDVDVSGDLTIKGITKPIIAKGKIVVKDGAFSVSSDFSIKLSDYDITGVPIDAGKVAKEPKVTVSAEFN